MVPTNKHKVLAAAFAATIGLGVRRDDPGDWPEDSAHENGDYENECAICGATFFGHKRRVICKRHANQTTTNPPT